MRITENHDGSMLMEVVVGLGIIALFVTVSIPYFRQFQSNMILGAAAREMAADLRYAQQLTVTEQITHGVEFDDVFGNYRVVKIDAGAATTTLKTVDLHSDLDYESISGLTDNRVIFNSYGGVTESGTVTLVNSGHMTKSIEIKPSGYVRIEQ